MRNHIVLCGLGKLGFSILEILHQAGEEVVVVTLDARPELLRRARKMTDSIILDDGREPESLREACVESARALIIATSSDLVNLEIALDARKMAPHVPIVLRMYDRQLTERVRNDLNLAAVLNAAELSAPVFVAAALGEQLLRTFEIDGGAVNIFAIPAGEAPDGAGMSLAEFAERFSVTPIALRRAQGDYNLAPPLREVLREGDEVVAAGTDASLRQASHGRPRVTHRWVHMDRTPFGLVGRVWKNAIPGLRYALLTLLSLIALSVAVFHFTMHLSWLDALYFTITIVTTVGFGDINLGGAHPAVKLFGSLMMLSGVILLLIIYGIITDYVVRQRVEQILGARRTNLRDHIVVVGLGNIGYRVAERLNQLGEQVAAIERDENSEMVSRLRDQIPLLIGDGGSEKMLLRAGVDRARAVVAASDDDLANLRIAQAAELLNPRVRTIVRLFQSSLAEKLGTSVLGVDHALNPARAAAATFAACAVAPDVLQAFTLGNRLLLLRSRSAAHLVTQPESTVQELREENGVLALLRRHGNSFRGLQPDDTLTPEDDLIILEEYHPRRDTDGY